MQNEKLKQVDWYEKRDKLKPGMVFKTYDGSTVMLDRRVAGDGTRWFALLWHNKAWLHEDFEIEPGDLVGEPLPEGELGGSG